MTFFLVKKSQAAPGKRKSSATWSKNRRLAALHVANPAASGGIQPAPSPSQPFAAVRGTLHALLTTSPGAPCERVLLQPCSGPASPSARPKTNRRHSFLPCNYPTASQDTQPNFRSASTSKSAACCISPACSFLRSPLSFVIPQPRRCQGSSDGHTQGATPANLRALALWYVTALTLYALFRRPPPECRLTRNSTAQHVASAQDAAAVLAAAARTSSHSAQLSRPHSTRLVFPPPQAI